MFESLYITLVILAFMMLVFSFFVAKSDNGEDDSSLTPKFGQQLVLLGVSAILFGGLAAASADVEFITCTSTTCSTSTHFFDENMYLFGFFALISSILFLVKSFDAFSFVRGI